MPTNIFVNLPTEDLERSKSFYSSLGWSINPLFTDEKAACIVIEDNIYFMVLTRVYFQTFTDKKVADPHTHALASTSFSRDSREAVDEVIAKGLAAGGSEPRDAQDYGFMYSRDLEDPDGNLLSFLYMSAEAVEKGPETFMAEQSGTPSA